MARSAMMTYGVGATSGPAVAKAISEYYLSDTLQTQTSRAAEYYAGRSDRADDYWHHQVIDGRLEMGQHRAELSPVSQRMASSLALNGRQLSQERIANLLSLKQADGEPIAGRQIQRPQADGKKPPVGFLDLTLSAPKSLSAAWGLAPSKAERDQLLGIHRTAVMRTMDYVANEIGWTRRGGKKNRWHEPGEIAWLGFQHYTSRPVGEATADPQLHTHNIVLPHVLTADGKMRALDLDRLNGRIKEFGYVYQAHVATEARKLGINVEVDECTGTVRLADIPDHIVDLFSKRHEQAITEADKHATRIGLDWGELSEEQKIGLMRAGAYTSRQTKDETNDLASWSRQADAAGYRYETVLNRAEQPSSEEEHTALTYQTALSLLADEFRRRAVLDELELRQVAAKALVTTGIKDAGTEIDETLQRFRRDGVDHEGQRVQLLSGEASSIRGKPRVRVTTRLHVAQEQEAIRLARAAAGDLSAALRPASIDKAAGALLARHPEIDASGGHWTAQQGMMSHLGSGGRLGVVIGVPGSGKTFGIAALVDAWRTDGRQVYGVSVAWRQAADLKAPGIEERASIAAFLKRVENGRYQLDHNSVVVVDEVGLVGSRQMLDLLRIQSRTGAQMVMIGDPRQNQPIEGASGLELLRQALGDDTIPRLLHSVRQDSEREREIAALLRRGKVDDTAAALAMKQQDGTALLVAGGREATVQRVAELWRERLAHNSDNPRFSLTVSAPTNADARELGAAIRAEWRRDGHLGEDTRTVRAIDRTGDVYDLALAVGDRVRLFDRVFDPVNRRRALANNGDIVEIRSFREDGIHVRNAAGTDGFVSWAKIRSREDGPVRLAHGYVVTVDTAQGSTATEHIHALPSGSRATQGFKTYTAATRHRTSNWLVIDEAAERREISERAMIGHKIEIGEEQVWKNVARNLARQPLKPNALSVMQRQQQQQQGM